MQEKKPQPINVDQPARYGPEGNIPPGFQKQAEKQEDQHMHAKVQNSDMSSPLQIQFYINIHLQKGKLFFCLKALIIQPPIKKSI